MIQTNTRLKAADNTGARQIMCIGMLGAGHKKYARVGDIITATVKKATPAGAVKKGEVVRAVHHVAVGVLAAVLQAPRAEVGFAAAALQCAAVLMCVMTFYLWAGRCFGGLVLAWE